MKKLSHCSPRGASVIMVGIMLLAGAIVFFWTTPEEVAASAKSYSIPNRIVTDHTNMIQGPFQDGPAVTKKCLECHANAGEEMMTSVHWEWLGKPVKVLGVEEPVRIGKKNLINNFCVSAKNNEKKCTACHAGYGWTEEEYDFSKKENVDCLVCHDHSGQYVKGNYGYPAKGVDLEAAAKSVTFPNRSNCGSCHFNGGGGNGVKHGDLDNSLMYPSARIDVHMGKYDFVCIDCHQTENHQVKGRSMGVSVERANGVDCLDCHENDLHRDQRIDAHTNTVACQTCHIPEFAVDDPTKMTWDWSTAGQDLDIKDKHQYMKIKGSFKYDTRVTPEYDWYNGTNKRYLLGDKISPEKTTRLNPPLGDIYDANARITPFKIHRGKQIYDTKYKTLMAPTTAGKGGFWNEFDWDKALRIGAEKTGMKYSGHYDFATTEMHMRLSHMVAEKEKALLCEDCHSDNGRME
jgi:octaheme c-type cytochrome (tetrathionate reductase family)